jgi:hypothetical protein
LDFSFSSQVIFVDFYPVAVKALIGVPVRSGRKEEKLEGFRLEKDSLSQRFEKARKGMSYLLNRILVLSSVESGKKKKWD